MKKILLSAVILLAALIICTAGCTSNGTNTPGSITGTETYTITTADTTEEYKITFVNGVNTGDLKITYAPNHFAYQDEYVNKVVPEIISNYKNNPMKITQLGHEIEFTLVNTEVIETISGELLTITAKSETEVYLNGDLIDVKYFT